MFNVKYGTLLSGEVINLYTMTNISFLMSTLKAKALRTE